MGAILGLEKIEGNLKKYLRDMTPKIVEAAKITQTLVADTARHTVAVDTGALQRSIQEGMIRLKGTVVMAYVYALQDYASAQEYGPKGTSKRKWRFKPYLRPSMKRHEPDFLRLLKRAIKP